MYSVERGGGGRKGETLVVCALLCRDCLHAVLGIREWFLGRAVVKGMQQLFYMTNNRRDTKGESF